jgi:hypothetical protein
MRTRSFVLVASLAVACSSEDRAAEVEYRLSQRPLLPFPTDSMLVPDATRPTGLRIELNETIGKNLGDVDEALFLFGPDFAHALDPLDGWSTLGPVFSPVGEEADENSLEEHLLLVDLSSRTVIPTNKRAFGGKTMYHEDMYWVSARAPLPLEPKTRHAIVLLDGLLATSGKKMAASKAFRAAFDDEEVEGGDPARVASAKARLAGVAEVLESMGIKREDVLSADTFTTQSLNEGTDALLAAFRARPDPEISTPVVFLDPNTDPRWSGPDNLDRSHLRAIARITVQVPNYREDVKGATIFEAGAPVLQSHETVEALIAIPNGEGPFPIAVYQHGVGDNKESMWHFANELCGAGVVVIGFDAPLHGFRTDRPGSAATEFINIVEPALVADNFRQAQTESAFLVRAIDRFAALDLLGDGSRPLDTSRLLWIGNSLGSIIGSAVIGLEPRYQGGALMVGGGTLLEFFDRVLGGFNLNEFPAELFVAVAQAALDRGDPTNYVGRAGEKQVLLMQAMQDETMPAGATRALGRAMQLPQLAPVFEKEAGLSEVTGPITRRGWTQFSPAKHALAYSPGNTPEEYARSRAQLFHFVRTWAETGTGEIK